MKNLFRTPRRHLSLTWPASIVACLVFSVSIAFGQAPRTISHQGLLTDTSGEAVADGAKSMTFAIYDVPAGGAALWTETKDVETTDGIFHTDLGSASPITGVNFNQDLWLGVKVGADAEMTDRTKLSSVPSAFGLVMPFEDTLRVATEELGADGSETFGEGIRLHSDDASLGLYSSDDGMWGSGVQFGEISSGALQDKWAMTRETHAEGSSLVFSYGSNSIYPFNPTKVVFDTAGVVSAEGFAYGEIDTLYASIPGNTFFPEFVDAATVWEGDAFTDHAQFRDQVHAALSIPDGATIVALTCTIYDVDVDLDLQCRLCQRIDQDACEPTGSPLPRSTGSSGVATYTQVASPVITVDNKNRSYFVQVRPLQGANINAEWKNAGHDLEIIRAYVTYTVSGPQ